MSPFTVLFVLIPELADLSQVPELLDKAGIPFEHVACDNWKWSDRNPVVTFRFVHCSDKIYLHFHIVETEIIARAAEDDGRVWEDSCCEFFLSPDRNDWYYNFECNCIGTLVLHGGLRGGNRPSGPAEAYSAVRRFTTLGREPIGLKTGRFEWDLVEEISVSALWNHDIKSLDGLTMAANFYKCGDALAHPHYLSWNPIDLPKPLFHCPEFFRPILFAPRTS